MGSILLGSPFGGPDPMGIPSGSPQDPDFHSDKRPPSRSMSLAIRSKKLRQSPSTSKVPLISSQIFLSRVV